MARRKKTVEHSPAELRALEKSLKRYVDLDQLTLLEPTLELRKDFVQIVDNAFRRQEGILDFEDAKALRRIKWQKEEQQAQSSQAQG